MRVFRVLAVSLPFAAVTAAAQARSDTVSAAITNVRYEVTANKQTLERGVVDVAMTFTTDGTAPVVLSLPAWTPGAYEISNFATRVIGFTPTRAGRAVSWDKLDFDTWRIRSSGAGEITVKFSFAGDSLDNAKTWIAPNFVLFNGTNLFLYPEGRPAEFPAKVSVVTEPAWKIATSMPSDGAARRYASTNYHDLVDMPFFVGEMDLDSAQVSGKWFRLATYPAGRIAGAVRQAAWDQIKKVVPPEVAIMGEAPWDSYTLMQIVDSTYGGASGLEHQSSHVDVLSPPFVGSEFQPSLYAHEIFHAWNVKRLRPADLWPYVYSRAQPTPWLWVSEGITDYYADIALVRGGVVPAEGFWALTADKINQVRSAPDIALEDASLSTWVHPIDGTGYIYYPKGSLAGLMLDVMIRDASDNAKSLDAVMRELYETTYKKGRGFTSADFWGAVSRAAGGRAFGDFNAKYIDGREPFPWDSILPKAGMRAVQARVPRLGVFTQGTASGVVVTSVDESGAAYAAGVKPGDYLVSVGDISVEDQAFGEKFRAKYGSSAEGTALPIRVRRDAQSLTLTGQLKFAAGDITVSVDPNANPKAVRIRNGILGK